MSRTASIPKSLYVPILFRWNAGASPSAIVRWIEETNVGRKEPIHTSRSSVQRLLQSLTEANALGSRMQAILRAQLNAPWALEELEDIQGRFRALYEEFSQPGADPKLLHAKGQALTRWHGAIHRDLRLAGIAGTAAEQLMKANEYLTAKAVSVCMADDKAMPRAIPGVGDVGWVWEAPAADRPMEKKPEQPPAVAITTPVAAAPPLSSVETGGVEGVPESNDLDLQRIDESIRAGFTCPESSEAGEAVEAAEAGGVEGGPESNDLNVKRIDESIRAGFKRPEATRFPTAATLNEAAFRPEASA